MKSYSIQGHKEKNWVGSHYKDYNFIVSSVLGTGGDFEGIQFKSCCEVPVPCQEVAEALIRAIQ